MWRGAFTKHRDYEHNTYWEHIMANGGSYWIDPEPVRVKYDPIDGSLHEPSDRFYFVDIDLHGQPYEFLVPAESDLSQPNEDTIGDTFNDYMNNPVDGGRDWFRYLDFKHEETLTNGRASSRILKEPIPMGPPREFYDRNPATYKPSIVEDIFS